MPLSQEIAPPKVGVQYVVGTPPATPVLRPLRQPIYDSDIYLAAGTRELRLFVDNRNFPSTGAAKDERATNLPQPSSLGTPLEFDLVGFQTSIEKRTVQAANVFADLSVLYQNCVFNWFFGQTVRWLQIRLEKVPDGVSLFGNTTNTAETIISNGWPVVNNFMNFATLDKKARRIVSTETFANRIVNPAATALPGAANRQVTTYMLGVLYAQL